MTDQQNQEAEGDQEPKKAEDQLVSKESLPADQETKESQDLYISEEPLEKIESEDVDVESELARDTYFDTQYGEGHTYNPFHAQDQGLTYTPPTDPPTLPSEDPQSAEIGAGFAPSMESSDPDAERLPDRVDDSDLDLLDNVYLVLRNNSETAHLSQVKVQVDKGIVNLLGTVPTQDDIARVHSIVRELEGVVEIQNNLQAEPR